MNPTHEKQLQNIEKAVCQVFLIDPKLLHGPSRKGMIPLARHYFFYIAKQYTEFSYGVIGKYIGGRDHATALYGDHKIATWKILYPEVDIRLAEIYSLLTYRGDNEFSLSYLSLQAAYNHYVNFLNQ